MRYIVTFILWLERMIINKLQNERQRIKKEELFRNWFKAWWEEDHEFNLHGRCCKWVSVAASGIPDISYDGKQTLLLDWRFSKKDASGWGVVVIDLRGAIDPLSFGVLCRSDIAAGRGLARRCQRWLVGHGDWVKIIIITDNKWLRYSINLELRYPKNSLGKKYPDIPIFAIPSPREDLSNLPLLEAVAGIEAKQHFLEIKWRKSRILVDCTIQPGDIRDPGETFEIFKEMFHRRDPGSGDSEPESGG